jgi:hypothetical protein
MCLSADIIVIYLIYTYGLAKINYIGHLLWAPVLGALCFALCFDFQRKTDESSRPTRSRLGWAVFILSLTFLYGLGSNNQITFTSSTSSFFIFLALLLIQFPQSKPGLLASKVIGLIICSLFVTSLVMVSAWVTPYRQIAPVWTFKTEVEIPLQGGSLLKMPEPVAKFIMQWYDSARQGLYRPGTPIIDLTGRTPGAIFILGGYFPNYAWLGSGYKGSEAAAQTALLALSCEELASAWVITDYYSEDILHPAILSGAGVDYEREYTSHGIVNYPVGGINFQLRPLVLLSPVLPGPRAELCQARRAEKRLAFLN